MADRVLFLSWGTAVRGREERSLEVFNDAVGLYGRMQQEGRIERFEIVLLEPNTTVGGYFALHGSADQLAAVREDEDFRELLVAAQLIVEDLQITDGVTDAGIAVEMERFQRQTALVPQAH